MTHTRKHTSRVHNERLAAPCGSSDFEELSKTSPQAQRKVPVGVSTLPTSNLSQFYEHTDTSAPTHAHIHKHIPCRHLRPASSLAMTQQNCFYAMPYFFSHILQLSLYSSSALLISPPQILLDMSALHTFRKKKKQTAAQKSDAEVRHR